MGWNHDSILKNRREAVAVRYGMADREALLERIAELEAALYPFAYTLGSLDCAHDETIHGAIASSALFPFQEDDTPDDHVLVFDKETRELLPQKLDVAQAHLVEYETCESFELPADGNPLDGSFDIMSVMQSAPCASIGCGPSR